MKKRTIVIIISIVLLAAAGVAAYSVYKQNSAPSTPSATSGSIEAPTNETRSAEAFRKTGLEALQTRDYDKAIDAFKEARGQYESADDKLGIADMDNLIKNAESSKTKESTKEPADNLPSSGE